MNSTLTKDSTIWMRSWQRKLIRSESKRKIVTTSHKLRKICMKTDVRNARESTHWWSSSMRAASFVLAVVFCKKQDSLTNKMKLGSLLTLRECQMPLQIVYKQWPIDTCSQQLLTRRLVATKMQTKNWHKNTTSKSMVKKKTSRMASAKSGKYRVLSIWTSQM